MNKQDIIEQEIQKLRLSRQLVNYDPLKTTVQDAMRMFQVQSRNLRYDTDQNGPPNKFQQNQIFLKKESSDSKLQSTLIENLYQTF